jgi:uncharacterized protein
MTVQQAVDTEALTTAFADGDKTFIEGRIFFFVATATATGHPTCNLKGGAPGFVRVIAPDVLTFPDYNGNGMFLSLGNIVANPQVGLSFIDFESPKRLRVDGEASVSSDDPLIGRTVGAQLTGRVKARAIYPNCPRYIPKMQLIEPSIYAPRARVDPPPGRVFLSSRTLCTSGRRRTVEPTIRRFNRRST